jgi:predicted transcriptional regulator
MAAIKVRDQLWNELSAVAKRQKKSPTAVAQHALREYIRQFNDEELLNRSGAAARRAGFPASKSELVVKQYRRRRQSA